MTLVIDASMVFASLTDDSDIGSWARREMLHAECVAPEHMPAEVAHLLRRAVLRGDLSSDAASLAHQQLQQFPVAYFSYAPVANRVWDLRHNLSIYDGWYVAIAEAFGAPLATLDRRLAAAPGPLCVFRTPAARDTLETGME